MLETKILKILEFDQVLAQVAQYAVSDCTKAAVSELFPSDTLQEVRRLQNMTGEAYALQYKYLLKPVVQFDDTADILDKAKAGAVLQMGELLKVARLLRSARIAKKDLQRSGEDIQILKELFADVFVDEALETQIRDSIASDSEMKDDASDALKTIRRKILAANNKLKEKLAAYTRSSEYSKYLQDNLVTVRMGRFVLPVKSECRSSVPGLLHDQSSSGSTVFIEPFPIVELNNDLKYLQMEEQKEIDRILALLSDLVAQDYTALTICQQRCTALDLVFAKCNYSVAINGTAPLLNDTGIVNLYRARHPLIDPHKIVPVDVSVGRDYKLLIVTGPNTGGKTVCLKTVGLCCLMACCGIWLPCAENSEVSVFEGIYCDLGDEQSIEQSLSTFSAHIVNIVHITNEITHKSLVLMDELGAGTDPTEGAALSIGIIQYMEQIGVSGIITTHFTELKEYALVSPRLMNACMQFDEATLKPTYKLIMGIPGVSNALKIAGTLGLNDTILQKARESIAEEDIRFEEVLHHAEQAKSAALAEAEALQSEKQLLQREREAVQRDHAKLTEKLERIQSNAKAETKRLVQGMIQQAEDLMQALKDKLRQEDEEALRQARILRNQLSDPIEFDEDSDFAQAHYAPINSSQIKVGQRVYVKSLHSEGVIKKLPDRKQEVQVQAGNMRLSASVSDLALPIDNTAKSAKKAVKPQPRPQKADTGPVQEEVMLLGHTVSEAITVLEPIIISSAGSNKILRIVHGKGTGALGKGIQRYLAQNALVAAYRYGGYGEGDTGVTIAEIK